MAGNSTIEWTEATWNPIAGCSIVSPGCTNCYAMRRVAPRLSGNPATPHYHGTVQPSKGGPVWTGKIGIASDQVLTAPLRWKRPRMIFVNSTSDLFHPGVPEEVIDRVFAVMALCPQHTFQVLTKRPERMRQYLTEIDEEPSRATARRLAEAWPHGIPIPDSGITFPLANAWLGTSVEDQKRADERIPHLLQTPAAVRFISAEPLLGPLDLSNLSLPGGLSWNAIGRLAGLNWVIVGGESGNGARPMHPDWARSLRDQCAAAGVPFFFKQWGEWGHWPDDEFSSEEAEALDVQDRYAYFQQHSGAPEVHMRKVGKHAAGRLLDGFEHNGMPSRTA